jgi:hypothetical protein
MRDRIVARLNTVAVNAYKAIGIAVLAAILAGLLSYLAMQGFFVFSRNWVAPTILSPTDERVLRLSVQLAEQTAARDRLAGERRELQAKLEDAERVLAQQLTFQQQFRNALRSDRSARSQELSMLLSLRAKYAVAQDEVLSANRAYAGLARTREDALLAASMVDRERYLTTNHQLAEMSELELSLAQRGIDLQSRIGRLQRDVHSIDTMAVGAKGDAALSLDLLKLQQDYVRSTAEVAKAAGSRDNLAEQLRITSTSLERFERLVGAIRNSPYLKAMEDHVTVAFVPYENLMHAHEGAPLYRCAMGLIVCHQVGVIGPTLDGEVQQQHPIRTTTLRGAMVEIRLTDGAGAREKLLHVGHPPLLF